MSARILCALVYFVGLLSNVYAQVPNDDPCNAIALAVGINCNFATFSNAGANASIGVPAPGCANYLGGDVWFSVTVPASGALTFDSNTGVISDGGMAVYSGTCNALNLIECNDDFFGLMPSISQTGLIPGATIWIRMWEYGNDNNGTFDICVYDLSAPPAPPCTTPICSAPIPDDCNTACALGTLSAPPPCPATTVVNDNFCLTNIGASAENPYNYLSDCQGIIGNNMSAPAADTWYSFTATSSAATFTVAGLNTPNIALYQGTNCANSFGLGCNIGFAGSVSLTYNSLSVGQSYLVRISGGDSTDIGNFNLGISSYNNCDDCLINSSLVVNPTPLNGLYLAGQTVEFCYTVESWDQTGVNWLHSVVPFLGPGWDLSSLAPTVTPPSCDLNGQWGWYNAVTSSNTGLIFGPGFFYDSSAGDTDFPANYPDNNPGDNFGDNCAGPWTFCWEITVGNCPPNVNGENLNVSIETFGDSETGSWTTLGCATDPVYEFFSTASCCPAPQLNNSNPICVGGNDGEIYAETTGSPPFTFIYESPLGNVIQSNTHNQTADTLTGLNAGWYFVTIQDNGGCSGIDSIELIDPAALNGTLDTTICQNFAFNFNGTLYNALNTTGVELLTSVSGCDSSVTVTVNISPLDSTFSTSASCNPIDTGIVSVTNPNQFGCDSVHTITTTLSSSDSTFANATSCSPLDTGLVSVTNPNQFTCDSVHTIVTTLLPSDSTFANATSCNPIDTGIVSVTNPNQFGCDSVHTTATTLLPSDSTFANATSCNPLDTGVISVTNPNQFGCDSVHTTATSLLPSDATFANASSCNPLDTGVVSVTNQNQFGCDSVHTIITTLLPSNSTFVSLNSCNPADTGIVSVTNLNQFGCDSTHIIATILLPSSSSLTQLNACDSITWIDGNTYTSNTSLVDTLIAANGCDSVATIQISIAQSSAIPIQILLCPNELPYLLDNGVLIDGSQGTIVDSLSNTFGCDSVITYDITYAPDYYISPDMLLASLGDSVSFAINNPSTDVLVSYTSDNGENCESPCNDYLLYPTEAVNNYYFSLIDTVTECTYSDILTIEINLYSELNVPNIFTPNGDGSNETFRCFGKNIDQYQLSVFDRWGGKMFETNLLDEGWDGLFLGQAIENGIYIAIIQATGLDGQKYTITQNIKLVR